MGHLAQLVAHRDRERAHAMMEIIETPYLTVYGHDGRTYEWKTHAYIDVDDAGYLTIIQGLSESVFPPGKWDAVVRTPDTH